MISPLGKKFILSVFAIFMVAPFALGATPNDYANRIGSARITVEMLLADLRNGTPAREQEAIASIKSEIPASESIEWNGGSVLTNNQWLHNDLKRFAETTQMNSRQEVLISVSERLLSLEATSKELKKEAASGRSKDEDKQKLGEILQRPEYQKSEKQGESLFQKWWREFVEWLSKLFPDRPDIEPAASNGWGTAQIVLQILVFAAAAALVLFLLYRFLPFFRGSFATRSKEKSGDRVILGERIDERQSAFDLFGEAERLAREGDLRSAIRKGYIALLCDLADRKLIRLDRSKTNRDYLRDVRRIEPLFENVRGLTSRFEVSWYGLRAAEIGDWEAFRSGYQQTVAEARKAEK